MSTSYAEELKQKAPNLKARFDQAILAEPDQIDRNTIPAEHAVLLAKYLCEVDYNRPGLYPQVMRQSSVAYDSHEGYRSLQATIDAARVDEMDADMAATFALGELKRIVEYDRWIEGMLDEQRAKDGAGGRGE